MLICQKSGRRQPLAIRGPTLATPPAALSVALSLTPSDSDLATSPLFFSDLEAHPPAPGAPWCPHSLLSPCLQQTSE